MSVCRRCAMRGKAWEGSEPECGFDTNGVFIRENWNCATLNELRTIAEGDDWPDAAPWFGEQRCAIWSDDQRAALIAFEGEFIVLGWYKHRGRTEVARFLSGTESFFLTLEQAEAFLAAAPASGPTGEERE